MSQSHTDGQAALEKVQGSAVLSLLDAAIRQGAPSESVQSLVQILREERAFAAKMEFSQAMHRAQQRMGPIRADAVNPQTHSKYATDVQLDRVLRPIYSEEGFALSFNTDPTSSADLLWVTCCVTHVAGHSENYRYPVPIVTKGPKGNDVMTATHAAGSAGSYGKRYLIAFIFNIQVQKRDDDDGNKAGGSDGPSMDEGRVLDFLSNIEASATADEVWERYGEALKGAGVPQEIVSKLLKGERVDVIGAASCKKEAQAFVDAKNKQLGVLKRGGKR